MNTRVLITGVGSVSPFGALAGPIAASTPELRALTRWPTPGIRRAHLVAPFQQAEVAPGLKTRRMDRLSVWALVAAHLAQKDAGIRPVDLVAERVGVTFGTAFGCVELTESFMMSIARNGHAKADPIVFPETLGNLPASHVARQFGLKGPNVTVSRGLMSSECALVDAVAEIECGEASMVLVLAGDVVTRGIFDWYEAAGRIAPECLDGDATTDGRGQYVPGEGVGALVLEDEQHAMSRGASSRARVLATLFERHHGADEGEWNDFVRRLRTASGAELPLRSVSVGPGVRLGTLDPGVTTIAHHREVGMFGGGGAVGLSLALACQDPGSIIALGGGAAGQRIGVMLETGGAQA